VDTEYIGVCVATCHLATAFEDAPEAIDRLTAAGLPVVKSQLSAALHVADPAGPRAALGEFVEDRFLHQVREPAAAGVLTRDDLPDALGEDGLPAEHPWRVHFHLPLHAAPEAPLANTDRQLVAAARELIGGERA